MPEAEASASESVANAVYDEGESRDWGTDREDIEAYAAIAAGAAGAAACAAVSAGAAAPLCAWIASEIGEWLAGTVYGWFDGESEEAEAARQRRADVRAHFVSLAVADELSALNGQSLEQKVYDLIALFDELNPSRAGTWIAADPNTPQRELRPALLLLMDSGAPIVSRFGSSNGQTTDATTLGLEGITDYWFELDALGISTGRKTELVTDRALDIFDRLEHAYIVASLAVVSEAAAVEAVRLANIKRPTVRAVGGATISTAQYEPPPPPAMPPPPPPPGELKRIRLVAELEASPRHVAPVPPAEQSWGGAAWRTGAAVGVAGLLVGAKLGGIL